MTGTRPPRKHRDSAIRSGYVVALTGAAIACSTPCGPRLDGQDSAASGFSRVRALRECPGQPGRPCRSVGWLDSEENSSQNPRACSARQTQIHQFGPIRLIDVGDEVPHLADFFSTAQREAAARHERCLVIASLATCPSCAAIGFGLASGDVGRALGPLTILRVDVAEFAEELLELGVRSSQVPAFALLDAEGRVKSVLEGVEWPGNDPAEFLPLLSKFVRGQLIRQRGGRHSEATRGWLEL